MATLKQFQIKLIEFQAFYNFVVDFTSKMQQWYDGALSVFLFFMFFFFNNFYWTKLPLCYNLTPVSWPNIALVCSYKLATLNKAE